jgi:hypothetical protein
VLACAAPTLTTLDPARNGRRCVACGLLRAWLHQPSAQKDTRADMLAQACPWKPDDPNAKLLRAKGCGA